MQEESAKLRRIGISSLQAGIVAIAAVVVTLIAGGASADRVATTDVLRTRRLEVVDTAGRVRAIIGARSEEEFGVWLNDEEGRLAVRLFVERRRHGAGDAQRGLVVHEPAGGSRARITYSGMGSSVTVLGSTMHTGFSMGARGERATLEAAGEEAKISLSGEDSRIEVSSLHGLGRVLRLIATSRSAGLGVFGAKEKAGVIVAVGPDERGRFVMLDSDGQPEFEMPAGSWDAIREQDEPAEGDGAID